MALSCARFSVLVFGRRPQSLQRRSWRIREERELKKGGGQSQLHTVHYIHIKECKYINYKPGKNIDKNYNMPPISSNVWISSDGLDKKLIWTCHIVTLQVIHGSGPWTTCLLENSIDSSSNLWWINLQLTHLCKHILVWFVGLHLLSNASVGQF